MSHYHLDGLTAKTEGEINKALIWRDQNVQNQLVIVTSQQLTFSQTDLDSWGMEQHNVLSWTKEDYDLALQEKEIKAQVESVISPAGAAED